MTGATPPLPNDLAPDWHSLLDLLDTYDWREVPCRSGQIVPTAHWTSDDAHERALAAEACGSCPAIGQCRAYGAKYRKEVGVYGGAE